MFEADDAQIDLSRRQWLRGSFRKQQLPLRPPWAQEESRFAQLCTRCDACIEACEYQLIYRGSGGFPEIKFQSDGCDFCGDCLTACENEALQAPAPAPSLAWKHRASIDAHCLSLNGIVCRACGDACDTEAIGFKLQTGGRAIPILDQKLCNGCGECLTVCPNDSISLDIPEAS